MAIILNAAKFNKFIAINGTSSKCVGNVIRHQVLTLQNQNICSKSICKSRKTSTKISKANEVPSSSSSSPTSTEPRNPDKWLYKKICTKSIELCSQAKEKVNRVCELHNSKKPLKETCLATDATMNKRKSHVNKLTEAIRLHPLFKTNYLANVQEKMKHVKDKMNTYNDRFIANFICGTRSRLYALTRNSKYIQKLSTFWRELEIESREAKEARKIYIEEIQKKLPKKV